MLILNNVKIPLEADFSALAPYAAKELKTGRENIRSAVLYKKSVDARRKEAVHFCCSLLVEVKQGEKTLLKKCKNAACFTPQNYVWQKARTLPDRRPVIVGFGPAGIFAALTLARAGLCPLVLERGQDADRRTAAVQQFFAGGPLDPESNVQFGEGGAGTFSDGKLNTGIKDPRCRAVLETFVRHGAPADILTDAKPHIGTDILVRVVKSIRREIETLGGEIRFETRVSDLLFAGGRLYAVAANGEEILCDRLVLATGHSARDVFSMLQKRGVSLLRKPFSVGVRIEHLQSEINRALYGDYAEHPALGAADYKMAVHLENGRGVYTFCMCPGGEVINASSEKGGIAVNGMSDHARQGENANSALLVGVEPSDLAGEDPLEGCRFQQRIEQAAYAVSSGLVPITTVGAFVYQKPFALSRVRPTVKPAFVPADFDTLFPSFVTESLRQGIVLFDRKIAGFAAEYAVLTAPETRSSSPVRILRGEDGQSISAAGLYPCGEGAGYAGGIMSAATDGIRIAEHILDT